MQEDVPVLFVLVSSDPCWGPLRVCVTRLRAPGCGWGALVVSAAVLLVLAALGLALALILQRESQKLFYLTHHLHQVPRRTQTCFWHRNSLPRSLLCAFSCVFDVEIKAQEMEDQFLSTRSPNQQSAVDAVSQPAPTTSASKGQVEVTASPQPAKVTPSERRKRRLGLSLLCFGLLVYCRLSSVY